MRVECLIGKQNVTVLIVQVYFSKFEECECLIGKRKKPGHEPVCVECLLELQVEINLNSL